MPKDEGGSFVTYEESVQTFWGEEQKAIGQLYHQASSELRKAFMAGNAELITDVHHFLRGLVQTRKILIEYRQQPGAQINVISRSLGLTRSGLYFRLEKIGLDPSDFRDPRFTVIRDLLPRSKVLAPLQAKIFGVE
ncbi:MAG: hypothetical protein WEA04_03655 [Candidatus Andersenbacteria bacterium]